jgi:hypothetical protein
MALASSLLMFAGSPQTILAVATGQQSFLLLVDILPAYGRHVRGELQQNLSNFYLSLQSLLQNWKFASQGAKCVKSSCAYPQSSLTGVLAKQLQAAEQQGLSMKTNFMRG